MDLIPATDTAKNWHYERRLEDRQYFAVICAGQSNSTNAAFAYTDESDSPSLCVHNGIFYNLMDPVVGGTGGRGSPWPYYARSLMSRTGVPSIILQTGVMGASVDDWLDNLDDRMARRIAAAEAAGVSFEAILWCQGEADTAMTRSEYADKLGTLIQSFVNRWGLPIYISRTSYRAGVTYPHIVNAQNDVIAAIDKARAGPGTDYTTDRYDGTHFGAEGVRQVGINWATKIIENHFSA